MSKGPTRTGYRYNDPKSASHTYACCPCRQEGAAALDQALRAACTHGHTEVVLRLLGALGAGRQEAKAACRGGESGGPLSLLLSTALEDAAECGDRDVVELLLEVRGGWGGGSSDEDITRFRALTQHAHQDGCWVSLALRFGVPAPLRPRLPRSTSTRPSACPTRVDATHESQPPAGPTGYYNLIPAPPLTRPFSHPVCRPQAGANAQHDHSRALRNAATWGNEDALAALLAAGADPRDAEGAALVAAAWQGHGGVIRQLLAAGADAATNGNLPLCFAAQYGHEEVLSDLLAAGADGGFNNGVALCLAAHRGREGVVRQLLDWGVPYTAGEGHALLIATKEGHAGVVKMLLQAGPWPQDTLKAALRVAMYLWWFEPQMLSARRRGRQEAAQVLAAAGGKTGAIGSLWARALLAMVGTAVEAFRQVVQEPSNKAVLVTAVLVPIPLVTMGVPLWLASGWVKRAMSAKAR